MRSKKNKMVVIVLIILGIVLITSGTTLAFLNCQNKRNETNDITTNKINYEIIDKEDFPVNIENNNEESKEEIKESENKEEVVEEKEEAKVENKNNDSKTNTTSTNTKQNTSKNKTTTKNDNTTNKTSPTPTPTPKANSTSTIDISKIVSDKEIIPDKYNTGATGNLKKYTIGDSIQGLDIRQTLYKDITIPVINFNHVKNQNSYYLIENIDFTNYERIQFITANVSSKIKIVFKNCKFAYVSVNADLNDNISLEFENCTMQTFNGSNATLNKCKFGQGKFDAINPFKNVTIKNSYISDIAAYDISGDRHYDGVQITGTNSDPNFLVQNIHFYNTRFETPYVREIRNGVLSKSSVNAPIMVQMKFNNGTNISFENIYVNGGGYTVYAISNTDHTYTNVTFKNVKIGYGHVYHELYPVSDKLASETKFINFGHYDSLYVSSVWKDNSGIHVITTNDTLVERKLTCETDNDKYTFTIKAHPKLTKENSVNYQFSDMPYDIDKTINDKNAKFIRCYDTTSTNTLSNSNLIRTQKF